jgi:hypothetical protein
MESTSRKSEAAAMARLLFLNRNRQLGSAVFFKFHCENFALAARKPS